jgi:hypothetical protein
MCERFIKFIPSEEAFWLMQYKPNAFLLLAHIANTARRRLGHPDGLLIGQCHLQSWKFYGFSEQEYRTAKKILVDRKHIKIIETNRTRQKSTTGTTTGSTLVEIISLTVYDINPEEGNDRINDRATTDQRLTNDKQEGIRKKKKDKEIELPQTPPSPILPKIKFRELVELTQAEYDSLLAKNGIEFLNCMLDTLDAYKGSSGKKYDSDFHTMKQGGWVVSRVKKDLETQKQQQQKASNEKPFRTSPERIPVGNTPGGEGTKFSPSRVLRGSPEPVVSVEGDKELVHG